MEEQQPKWNFEDCSIDYLQIRRKLVQRVINEVKINRTGEPLDRAVEQLRAIDKVLIPKLKAERKRLGIPEPEPVRVSMKPIKIKMFLH